MLRKALLVPKLNFFCLRFSPFLLVLSTVDMKSSLLFLPSAAFDTLAELSCPLFSLSLFHLLNWSSGISRPLDESTLNIFKDWKWILKTNEKKLEFGGCD